MSNHNGEWVVKPDPGYKLAGSPTGAPDSAVKVDVRAETQKLGERMEELFDLMFFAGTNSLLIVLQGMDAAGKDGTIRHILGFCHAQSCRVASFKVPTPPELAHDFLWRCHSQTPGKGEITIFNRSHYEDVGVVRVHNLAPEEVWRKRYGHINDFEKMLAENGTIILKVFLHVSKEEQEARLIERENDPDAAWKLSVGDWKEREHWDSYQRAYSEAIGRCCSKEAPWLVVPADKKWWRDRIVTEAIVKHLEPYEKGWRARLEEVGAKAKAELAEFRAGRAPGP